MKYRLFCLLILLIASFAAQAQVQVRNEPRHKNVIENKYFRVLDVNIPPHDTTLQHIHCTSSVILMFTNTITAEQLKGHDWVKGKSTAGSAFYRDFSKDTVIHKVANWDTVPFHVTDIELLSAYEPNSGRKPLPFNVLFENDKVIAYRLIYSSINRQAISNRGPMIAALVTGDIVILHDTKNDKLIGGIVPKKEIYIEPGTSFYLTKTGTKEIDLVLFEIK